MIKIDGKQINNEFKIGQRVYVLHEVEPREHMIISITINSNGIIYGLVCGPEETAHYDIELADKKQVI